MQINEIHINLKLFSRIALVLLFSILVNCNILSTPKTFSVKPNKKHCVTEHVRLCNIIKEPSVSDEWRFLYEWIDGFDYEWGYDYTIYVDESRIEPRPSNGHQYKYKLIEVISKVKNYSKYSMSIVSSNSSQDNINLIKKSHNEYLMYSYTLIKCKKSDCLRLDELIKNNYSFLLILGKSKKPLSLLEIKCSSKSELLYWTSCFK